MKKEFPTLNTDRLLLRKIEDKDIEQIFAGLSHPEVVRYYGVSFHSLEATKEQMNWFKELEEQGTGIWWAICDSRRNTFYGAAGFNNLSREHRKAEIGFWLLPAFWGRGIIGESLPLIIEFAFQNLRLHRIEAYVESLNNNSKKVMDKLGFKHEGTMVDAEIKNGDFISIDIYAKLNTETV